MPQAALNHATPLAKTSEGRARNIERMLAPMLEDLGYDIVRVQVSGDKRVKIQLMIERRDGAGMTVDDCASASRAAGTLLEVEDPIRGAYIFEVSSPGIDRPLTRLGDFERFSGFEARVELCMPHDGRRRFRGRLAGISGDQILLDCDEERVALPFAELAKAKLVLNDELIAARQDAGEV